MNRFAQKFFYHEQVAKLSVQNAVVSEYTNMVLLEMEKGKISIESTTKPQVRV